MGQILSMKYLKPTEAPIGAGRSSPRPVEISYSGGRHPGHCKNIRNAIVNATRHVITDNGAARANILVDGEVVADLDKVNGKCFITWRVKWARTSELW